MTSPRPSREWTRPIGPPYAVAAAVAAALVLATLVAVTAGHGDVFFDASVFRELHGTSGTETTELAGEVTSIGDGVPLLAALGLLACAARARWGSWRPLQVATLALALAAGASTALKMAVGRARPPLDGRLIEAHGNSFPSGHTTAASAGYLGLGLAVAGIAATRWARVLAVALSVLAAVAIGWTRIELGVHWPTDVAGGWALGVLAACTALLLCSRWSVPVGPGTGRRAAFVRQAGTGSG